MILNPPEDFVVVGVVDVDVAVVVVVGKVVDFVDDNLLNDVVEVVVVVVVEVVEYSLNEFNESMNFELRENSQNDSSIKSHL